MSATASALITIRLGVAAHPRMCTQASILTVCVERMSSQSQKITNVTSEHNSSISVEPQDLSTKEKLGKHMMMRRRFALFSGRNLLESMNLWHLNSSGLSFTSASLSVKGQTVKDEEKKLIHNICWWQDGVVGRKNPKASREASQECCPSLSALCMRAVKTNIATWFLESCQARENLKLISCCYSSAGNASSQKKKVHEVRWDNKCSRFAPFCRSLTMWI